MTLCERLVTARCPLCSLFDAPQGVELCPQGKAAFPVPTPPTSTRAQALSPVGPPLAVERLRLTVPSTGAGWGGDIEAGTRRRSRHPPTGCGGGGRAPARPLGGAALSGRRGRVWGGGKPPHGAGKRRYRGTVGAPVTTAKAGSDRGGRACAPRQMGHGHGCQLRARYELIRDWRGSPEPRPARRAHDAPWPHPKGEALPFNRKGHTSPRKVGGN